MFVEVGVFCDVFCVVDGCVYDVVFVDDVVEFLGGVLFGEFVDDFVE